MTAPKLANGRIDPEGLTKRAAESDIRVSDMTPCPACGHSTGIHAFPHAGRWYWACFAPIGNAPFMEDRPECGCEER